MSEPMLLLIILVEGFITISAEILTIRQLIPVVGNSVVITSMVIGVFLLFLAYGYRRGGQYQKEYLKVLKKNFTKSAIWLGVGLSFTWVELFFQILHPLLGSKSLLVLTAYLLIITAPLVYYLGQTVPITMDLVKKAKSAGAVGSKILHLSTIGSFLGAILTSLLLMDVFGVAWTVVINYCLLMLLVLVMYKNLNEDGIHIIVLCCSLILVYQWNVSAEKNRFIKTNAFSNYEVVAIGDEKLLQVNSSFSSRLSRDNKGFAYVEYIKSVLFEDLKLKGKDILVLGAGGFTLSAAEERGNRFTYVDVDKDIKEVVESHYLNPIRGKFVAADARAFLRENKQKYDVIVSDVYSNKKSIPPHLLTREYWRAIRENLLPGGVAIVNVIARPTLEDAYSRRMDNTIRSEFQSCMATPFKYSSEINHIIYLCRENSEFNNKRKEYYSDGMNQAALDFFHSIRD